MMTPRTLSRGEVAKGVSVASAGVRPVALPTAVWRRKRRNSQSRVSSSWASFVGQARSGVDMITMVRAVAGTSLVMT